MRPRGLALRELTAVGPAEKARAVPVALLFPHAPSVQQQVTVFTRLVDPWQVCTGPAPGPRAQSLGPCTPTCGGQKWGLPPFVGQAARDSVGQAAASYTSIERIRKRNKWLRSPRRPLGLDDGP